MTNNELKLKLARMLAYKILIIEELSGYSIWWNDERVNTDDMALVLDTELLHCCYLVEQGLDYEQKEEYAKLILSQDGFCRPCDSYGEIHFDELFCYLNATWKQRTTALQQIVNKKV